MTENREVPLGWQNVSIGNVNDYRSTSIRPSDFPGELFELYSVPSFAMGSPEIVSGSSIGSSKQVVEPGDVLLCKINPRINRVWLVGSKGSYRQIASSEWIVVRQPMINSRYMLNYFSDGNFRTLICSEVTGVGGSLTRAQPKKVATYPLCVPSVNEQTQIANTLDELLAQVDSIKTRLDAIPTILKRFRQSVLAAAVSGGLTEDWRGKVAKSWKSYAIGDIAIVLNGKAFPSKEYADNGIRLLRPGNLHVTGKVVWTDKNSTFLPEVWAERRPELLLTAGALLMNLTAQSLKDEFLGRVCVLGQSSEPVLLNQRIASFESRLDYDITPYLYVYFKSPLFREFVDTLDSGTLIKHMSTNDVLNHRITLPDSAEQTEIVRRVKHLFTFADQIEQRLTEAQTRINQLTQSILAKAFHGALTADWREQHPELISGEHSAEALLAQIQAARAKLEPKKRARRKKVASR